MPWNSTFTKPNKPMRKVGKVGLRRLEANKQRKEQFAAILKVCEIAPILREKGITFTRCRGPMTWAHARKRHRRSKKAVEGTPEHEETIIRACENHHYFYLDVLPPDQTCELVMLAIRRRKSGVGR